MTSMVYTSMSRVKVLCRRACPVRGIVLPMALILLVIISLAGLLAARNAATHEQFSNNMRTTQVARQFAEAALRYCESVAIDIVLNDGAAYPGLKNRLITAPQALADVGNGAWNTSNNWSRTNANLIEYAPDFDAAVQGSAQLKAGNRPTCLIQAMTADRILVTARGLSNDAVLDGANQLVQGAEVWLQSIVSVGVPVAPAPPNPNPNPNPNGQQ